MPIRTGGERFGIYWARPRENFPRRAAGESRLRDMNDPPVTPRVIRRSEKGDARGIARLPTVLGRPTSAEAVESCWDGWAATGNFALSATQRDGSLAAPACRLFPIRRAARIVPASGVISCGESNKNRGPSRAG